MIVSYSGLGSYDKCPSQFQRKYVTKEHGAPYISSPAASRGIGLHKAVEDLINGKTDSLPKEIEFYTQFFTALRNQGAVAEEKFCFNKEWEPVDFEDHEAGMIRGLMDITMYIKTEKDSNVYELKSGKVYDDHPHQRNLYGMVHLLNHPDIETVTVTGVYMDLKKNEATTYYQNMMSSYKYMWQRKINKVQPPQPYPMRPGWYCRSCPYSKGNGGLCPN